MMLRTMMLSMILLITIIAATIYLALLLGARINGPLTCTACQIVTIVHRQEQMRELILLN